MTVLRETRWEFALVCRGGRASAVGAVEERLAAAALASSRPRPVMSSLLDHAEGGAGEELVEDPGGEVVAEHAGFDPSCQHG